MLLEALWWWRMFTRTTCLLWIESGRTSFKTSFLFFGTREFKQHRTWCGCTWLWDDIHDWWISRGPGFDCRWFGKRSVWSNCPHGRRCSCYVSFALFALFVDIETKFQRFQHPIFRNHWRKLCYSLADIGLYPRDAGYIFRFEYHPYRTCPWQWFENVENVASQMYWYSPALPSSSRTTLQEITQRPVRTLWL